MVRATLFALAEMFLFLLVDESKRRGRKLFACNLAIILLCNHYEAFLFIK